MQYLISLHLLWIPYEKTFYTIITAHTLCGIIKVRHPVSASVGWGNKILLHKENYSYIQRGK